jgi:NADPH2:quinone reductase
VRAVVVHEFGTPEPGPDDVLVDVGAVCANFVDLLVIDGSYQFLPARPFTPGKLPAGTVLKVGANVVRFKPGDRVLTTAEQGGYAEQAVAPAEHTYAIPDSMSFEEAAAIALAFDTAWFALKERARMAAGESVLVLGASGSVGNAALQLVKAFGGRGIAAISSPAREDAVRAAGAEATVDLSVDDIHNDLRRQAYALTDGKGVDIVIDCLGDKYQAAAMRAMAWRGRLVVVGFAAGSIPTIKANYLMVKNIEASGLQVSDYRKRMPAMMRDCFEEIMSLYAQGQIVAPPLSTLPLNSFAEALGQIRDRTARGRLVLLPKEG